MQAWVFVCVAVFMNLLLLFDRRPLSTEQLAANIERLLATNRPKSTTRIGLSTKGMRHVLHHVIAPERCKHH